MAHSRILSEIKQTKPFASLEQESIVSLLRTVDHVRRTESGVFAAEDLTEQQYNVLRILRGTGPDGLPTLSVAERLIEHTPGITRLIDRLEAKGLVRRERPARDRRQVYCFITEEGLNVLERLDPAVEQLARRLMQHLSAAQMKVLNEILEKIRDVR